MRGFGFMTSRTRAAPKRWPPAGHPPPAKLMNYRPNRPEVVDTTDVCVDKQGQINTTGRDAGLMIMKMEGT